jgi:uncharacterized membrane protein
MQIDLMTLLVIFGMASVTYATRVGGVLLMSRFTLSQRMKAWLCHIPGTVLVSIVAPTVITSGPAEALAALATALVALRTGNLLLAMMVGVGTVWGLRSLISS